MTDISKCDGAFCEKKEECYRYRAEVGHWQSYINPTIRGKACEYFWPIIQEHKIKEIEINAKKS